MKSFKLNLKLICVLIIAVVLIFNGLMRVVVSSPIPEIQQALSIGSVSTASDHIYIISVIANSPASEADLRAGDIIISVTNKSVNQPSVLVKLIHQNEGKPTDITIERNGKLLVKQVTPRINYPSNQGSLGALIGNVQTQDIQQTNVLVTIAKVTYDVYSGNSTILVSTGYKYGRISLLIIGLFDIFVGLYLIKFKKWALYAAFLFNTLSVVSAVVKIIMSSLGLGEAFYTLILPLIIVIASSYLLSKRKYFK